MNGITADEFKSNFADLLRLLSRTVLLDESMLSISCDQSPWLDSGTKVYAGDQLTVFSHGSTLLKGTDLSFSPSFQLWFRIGEDGVIFRGTRNSHSFTADRSGRLFLASYFPGEWSSKTGELSTPEEVYQQVEGVLTVVLLRWQGDALSGLRDLSALGDVDGLIVSEIQRLNSPIQIPVGWEYLWFLGPAEIYRSSQVEHKTRICCDTNNDVGLLQKNIELPLLTESRLLWAWKVDRLPSELREDSLPTHDYLSIAVEFDNGQDITYFWSAELAPETGFRCPIPSWTARETHVVVRSGIDGLGQWFDEERNLYRDYQQYIGGPLPEKIVKIWLIAVSFFQHKQGECQYADIRLVQGAKEVKVL